MAAIVAVVAVGGIGFAAFTTTAYVNGNAAAGTLGPLTWSDLGTPVATSTYVGCTVSTGNHSVTGTTQDDLFIGATNLAPGDQCTFTADLNNLGSIPANVYAQVTCVNPAAACLVFTYWDNFAPFPNGYDVSGGPFGPLTIGAGSYIAYTGTLGLEAGLGNSAQGWTCEFEITLSATAGT
jgi:hypothetical protein